MEPAGEHDSTLLSSWMTGWMFLAGSVLLANMVATCWSSGVYGVYGVSTVGDTCDIGLGRLTRLEFWLSPGGEESMGEMGDTGEHGDTGDTVEFGSWYGYGCECALGGYPVIMPRRPISGGRVVVAILGRWAPLLLCRESGSLGAVVAVAVAAFICVGGALTVWGGSVCFSTAGGGCG